MKRFVLGLMGVAFASAAAIAALSPASAAVTASGTTITKWDAQVVINMTLTPNYNAGFGQVKAVFGTQPAPTHGPNASFGAGDVDFGNVIAGDDYIYKYATEINVVTNDGNGFKLYGEGAAQFQANIGGSGPQPLNSTLFYVPSVASGDTNTGFSPGLPFQQTLGSPSSTGYAGPITINYGGVYPTTPMATSSTPNDIFYWDYLLKVPNGITIGGDYYVWIVYTVVGS